MLQTELQRTGTGATPTAEASGFHALIERWKRHNEAPDLSEDDDVELLRALTESRVTELSDIVAKLDVWKSTVCPEAQDEPYVQMIDQIVLSAFRDLRRLTDQ